MVLHVGRGEGGRGLKTYEKALRGLWSTPLQIIEKKFDLGDSKLVLIKYRMDLQFVWP